MAGFLHLRYFNFIAIVIYQASLTKVQIHDGGSYA